MGVTCDPHGESASPADVHPGPGALGSPDDVRRSARAGWGLRLTSLAAMAPLVAALGYSAGSTPLAITMVVALATGVAAGALLALDRWFSHLPGLVLALSAPMLLAVVAVLAGAGSTALYVLLLHLGAFLWGLDWARVGRLRSQTFLLILPVWLALFSDSPRSGWARWWCSCWSSPRSHLRAATSSGPCPAWRWAPGRPRRHRPRPISSGPPPSRSRSVRWRGRSSTAGRSCRRRRPTWATGCRSVTSRSPATTRRAGRSRATAGRGAAAGRRALCPAEIPGSSRTIPGTVRPGRSRDPVPVRVGRRLGRPALRRGGVRRWCRQRGPRPRRRRVRRRLRPRR